jgi:hypothetical protein
MDKETIDAIKVELYFLKLAEEKYPEIKQLRACACMGPLPECLCMKRRRLAKEFLEGDDESKN